MWGTKVWGTRVCLGTREYLGYGCVGYGGVGYGGVGYEGVGYEGVPRYEGLRYG